MQTAPDRVRFKGQQRMNRRPQSQLPASSNPCCTWGSRTIPKLSSPYLRQLLLAVCTTGMDPPQLCTQQGCESPMAPRFHRKCHTAKHEQVYRGHTVIQQEVRLTHPIEESPGYA